MSVASTPPTPVARRAHSFTPFVRARGGRTAGRRRDGRRLRCVDDCAGYGVEAVHRGDDDATTQPLDAARGRRHTTASMRAQASIASSTSVSPKKRIVMRHCSGTVHQSIDLGTRQTGDDLEDGWRRPYGDERRHVRPAGDAAARRVAPRTAEPDRAVPGNRTLTARPRRRGRCRCARCRRLSSCSLGPATPVRRDRHRRRARRAFGHGHRRLGRDDRTRGTQHVVLHVAGVLTIEPRSTSLAPGISVRRAATSLPVTDSANRV